MILRQPALEVNCDELNQAIKAYDGREQSAAKVVGLINEHCNRGETVVLYEMRNKQMLPQHFIRTVFPPLLNERTCFFRYSDKPNVTMSHYRGCEISFLEKAVAYRVDDILELFFDASDLPALTERLNQLLCVLKRRRQELASLRLKHNALKGNKIDEAQESLGRKLFAAYKRYSHRADVMFQFLRYVCHADFVIKLQVNKTTSTDPWLVDDVLSFCRETDQLIAHTLNGDKRVWLLMDDILQIEVTTIDAKWLRSG